MEIQCEFELNWKSLVTRLGNMWIRNLTWKRKMQVKRNRNWKGVNMSSWGSPSGDVVLRNVPLLTNLRWTIFKVYNWHGLPKGQFESRSDVYCWVSICRLGGRRESLSFFSFSRQDQAAVSETYFVVGWFLAWRRPGRNYGYSHVWPSQKPRLHPILSFALLIC